MPNEETQVSKKKMLDAIKRSGYLLEQRIQPILEKYEYLVDMNPVYLDSITGKTREYDFSALKLDFPYKEEEHMVWITLHGECINNTQPIVFFSFVEQIPFLFTYSVKCTGMPLRVFPNSPSSRNYEQSIVEFLNFSDWHHYCHGIHSTQYCSFKPKKGDKNVWMAWHEDQHHSVFESLIQSVVQEMDKRFSSWYVPAKGEKEDVNIELYYPVVILSGELYECTQEQGTPVLTKREHIQYRRSVVCGKTTETYHIDVIVESFFPKYLDIIEAELNAIINRLRRHKKHVLSSVERIVTLAREAKTKHKIKDFREILTGK